MFIIVTFAFKTEIFMQLCLTNKFDSSLLPQNVNQMRLNSSAIGHFNVKPHARGHQTLEKIDTLYGNKKVDNLCGSTVMQILMKSV